MNRRTLITLSLASLVLGRVSPALADGNVTGNVIINRSGISAKEITQSAQKRNQRDIEDWLWKLLERILRTNGGEGGLSKADASRALANVRGRNPQTGKAIKIAAQQLTDLYGDPGQAKAAPSFTITLRIKLRRPMEISISVTSP